MLGETLGSYKIVSEIGHGGMGVVYLAEHALIGKKVAVKLLRSDVASDQVERFLNEAKAAGRLHHPNLCEVIDFGHHPGGAAYIVMEYLAGESLAERLDHEPKLPPHLALAIARNVATALRAAHDGGIIHRDLKPGNIFLVEDPESPVGMRAKVLDFGIAKLTRDVVPSAVMTNSGAVIGTPRYMSPEQCRNARAVDGRTDIYSLGCILYEMLVGTPPFDYDNWAELVGAHLHEEPARPTELDGSLRPDIEELVLRMTHKQAESRFATMAEVVIAIDEVLRASGSQIAKATPPNRPAAPSASTSLRKITRASKTEMDPTMLSPDPKPDSKSEPKPAAQSPITINRESNAKWIIIGLIGLAAISGVVITVVVLSSKPEEVVMVGVETHKRDDLAEPPAPPPAKPIEPVTAPPEDKGSVEPPPQRPERKLSPDELLVEKLTRTFAKHGAAINACFGKTKPTEKISIRIQIAQDGLVQSARVSPEAVATTPIGACLTKVAENAAFGAQPKAVTIHVPISAK